ncbi:hypothetical protein [Oceanobacillus sp. CF4.6]|uniref:hypothetical protein n=1 Tax=Oceanobacillus sp. CF4.6 TaxID=3373080 RepID=UPI003EE52149
MYKVLHRFVDVQDHNKRYKPGDTYPKGDYSPSQERIKVLSTIHKTHKKVFIQKDDNKK